MIRPLKLILKFKKMKIIFISLISSLNGLFNVGIVLSFIWITFAIIGMTLFKDRFGYCDSCINFGVGIAECLPPRKWIIHPYNFDSIPNSLLTLLAVSTFDDWMSHLSIAANSDLAKFGPTELNNRWSANFFFMSFIVVGVWFMLNLIVGVLFANFTKAAQSLRKISVLSENQIKWVEMQKKILSELPSLIHYPRGGLRRLIWGIAKSRIYKNLTSITLLLNFFSNAFFSPESPKYQQELYKYFEWYFDSFYIVEGVLKLTSFHVLGYFSSGKRRLEFLGVSVSIFNSLKKLFVPNFFMELNNGDLWQRLFFSFQIIPQIRLFIKIKSLKKLFHTISFSFPMILSVMALFILVMFVYSLIGIILFKDVVAGEVIDDYVNFKNVLYAFMTLFKSCTGDEWILIMIDTRKTPPNCTEKYDCGSAFSILFFVSFIILIRVIIYNLFILILVQNFEEFYKNPLNPIPIFKDNIKRFKKGWNLYCEDNQNRIHSNRIVEFLKFIGEPLGLNQESNFLDFGRKIMLMEMKSDENNYIYFKEFLYSSMKGYFRDRGFFDDISEEAEKLLDSKEKKFFQRLSKDKKKISIFAYLVGHVNKKKIYNFAKPSIKLINPLNVYLNKLIYFKVWRKFTELELLGADFPDEIISYATSDVKSDSSSGIGNEKKSQGKD